MTKATYGTGPSIMMNIGEWPVLSDPDAVTSPVRKIGGKVNDIHDAKADAGRYHKALSRL